MISKINIIKSLAIAGLILCPISTKSNSKMIEDSKSTAANISFNFENIGLKMFLEEVEKIFKVSFIFDENIKTTPSSDSRSGYGSSYSKSSSSADEKNIKITFRTNKMFNRDQAWAVVDSFLGVAGLARVKISESNKIFRITKIDTARKEALPVFIGVNPNDLPDSGLIRYVYFLKNSKAAQMKATIDKLKSKSAILTTYEDLKALIFTDKAYNIKTLMKIVKELDSACSPVGISVLKLKEADPIDVANIYNELKKGQAGPKTSMYGMPSKQSNKYFLQQSTVYPEPRTKTLIIIGPPDANALIEKFITENIDTKVVKQRSKFHTIKLDYAPAAVIADIFNELTRFGESSSSSSSRYGGALAGNEKYFSKMSFEAEKQGNLLIVKGEEEDFKVVKKMIKDLDKPQPQVAIEVLIVNLEDTNKKGLNSKIHNKNSGNVNFQTSGFTESDSISTENGSLIKNLIGLATGASVGSTVLSLGKSSVWSLLSILSKDTKTNILSNPFLVTTNKYPAFTSLGEERRVVTETIKGGSGSSTSGKSTVTADLSVKITPRINSLGIINLDIDIVIENFTDTEDQNSGNKSVKTLHTNASVANGEVLAIGGLSKSSNKSSQSGVPVLSKIPLLGNLFKNKSQTIVKENLVVFITPKIVQPKENLNSYTRNKADFATNMMSKIGQQESPRDPIAKWVFKDNSKEEKNTLSNLISKNDRSSEKNNKSESSVHRSITSSIANGEKQ